MCTFGVLGLSCEAPAAQWWWREKKSEILGGPAEGVEGGSGGRWSREDQQQPQQRQTHKWAPKAGPFSQARFRVWGLGTTTHNNTIITTTTTTNQHNNRNFGQNTETLKLAKICLAKVSLAKVGHDRSLPLLRTPLHWTQNFARTPLHWTAQNFALFCASPTMIPWGSSLEFWWCFRRLDPTNVHVWACGLTDSPKTLNVHIRGTKIPLEDTQKGEERKLRQEREKKKEILGRPAEGTHLSGPTPLRLHFSGFGAPPIRAPLPNGDLLTKTWGFGFQNSAHTYNCSNIVITIKFAICSIFIFFIFQFFNFFILSKCFFFFLQFVIFSKKMSFFLIFFRFFFNLTL